uniref:Uncharacterized protein n=1 Tax=uncultured bacterium contig00032 TaxID=1181521 RepID=A0A806KAU1_9BACT|nr:hypothetical protein [uncultured bacterium contig00032]
MNFFISAVDNFLISLNMSFITISHPFMFKVHQLLFLSNGQCLKTNFSNNFTFSEKLPP